MKKKLLSCLEALRGLQLASSLIHEKILSESLSQKVVDSAFGFLHSQVLRETRRASKLMSFLAC